MLVENLKHLRKINNMTQHDLAEVLSIPRSTLGEYERGNTEPSISLLIKISKFFKVTLDDLLIKNPQFPSFELQSSNRFKVLAITVDGAQKSNVELVETKAEAGYLQSYTDPEYIKDLPKIHFPNLPHGTYRGFEINGDSMLPLESGSIVISKYVEKITEIKNGKTYIVISKNEGVVYKRLSLDLVKNELVLKSDNEVFHPYTIPLEEVEEVWQYYAHVGFSDTKRTFTYMLEEKINDIQKKVNAIYEKGI
jgi:transcriptional regulator with XRE-family HTH domain